MCSDEAGVGRGSPPVDTMSDTSSNVEGAVDEAEFTLKVLMHGGE